MSWWSKKQPSESAASSPTETRIYNIRAMATVIVGECGVCGVYSAHNHVHDDLSDDGRDCAVQVATGTLLCVGCWEIARSVEVVLARVEAAR